MNKTSFLRSFIFALLTASIAFAQDPVFSTSLDRPDLSLNGYWRYIVDPYETGYLDYRSLPFDRTDAPNNGAFYQNRKPADKTERIEFDFDASDSLRVPGDWNSQRERLLYYEGSIWYKTSFDHPALSSGHRTILCFGAVNYRADVYLNGVKLGVHIGGFTPFDFDVTRLLKTHGNFLVVKVDNKRLREGVPTLNTDWWNYGGITRDVRLIEVPETYIRSFTVRCDPHRPDAAIGTVHLDGSGRAGVSVDIAIPEFRRSVTVKTDAVGNASFRLSLRGVSRWSPDHPQLTALTVRYGSDTVREMVGFRTIATKGPDLLLNGERIFLRGISIHEENPLRGGRAYSADDARMLLSWAKELGCNFVRLAHYPHNEFMARCADTMGILVWEEIPVYWTIDWNNEPTFANAAAQLRALIERDRNRASVIIWSLANETPVSGERTAFLRRLADTARSLDNSRLISAALEQHGVAGDPFRRTIDDPLVEFVDVVSFNEYVGWYDGLPSHCRELSWTIAQDKPVIVSEFGGGAKAGFHADSLTRWSEEYQASLYRENIRMLAAIPQLRGMTPWILCDFRSPRRLLPGIQDGWNRKGLISNDGTKKMAFDVLREFYRTIRIR